MESPTPLAGHPAALLFDAVVAKDHEALVQLYAANARNSLISYLSMKARLARQQEFYSNAGTYFGLLCEIHLKDIKVDAYIIDGRTSSSLYLDTSSVDTSLTSVLVAEI